MLKPACWSQGLLKNKSLVGVFSLRLIIYFGFRPSAMTDLDSIYLKPDEYLVDSGIRNYPYIHDFSNDADCITYCGITSTNNSLPALS